MKQRIQKINRNTILGEILKKAGAERILEKYRLPCIFCPMASFEIDKLKIGEVCEMYGLNLEKILKELNSLS